MCVVLFWNMRWTMDHFLFVCIKENKIYSHNLSNPVEQNIERVSQAGWLYKVRRIAGCKAQTGRLGQKGETLVRGSRLYLPPPPLVVYGWQQTITKMNIIGLRHSVWINLTTQVVKITHLRICLGKVTRISTISLQAMAGNKLLQGTISNIFRPLLLNIAWQQITFF